MGVFGGELDGVPEEGMISHQVGGEEGSEVEKERQDSEAGFHLVSKIWKAKVAKCVAESTAEPLFGRLPMPAELGFGSTFFITKKGMAGKIM